MSAVLLLASTAAGMAAEDAQPLVPVPSGAEVWLQEELTDRVAGVGPVKRYRFVMPSLAALVPPMPEDGMMADLPPELLDEPAGDEPLTADEQAELDAALGDLAIEGLPEDDIWEGEISIAPVPSLGDEMMEAPAPSELAPPDSALPEGAEGAPSAQSEAAGDMAVNAGADIALPAAPDILMQDPVHRDIVWLCEQFVLPRLGGQAPRPRQVVISMASAPSPFGSFDPEIVQLFEGFSIPADRDACVWEPM